MSQKKCFSNNYAYFAGKIVLHLHLTILIILTISDYNLAIFLKAFKIFLFSTEKVRRLRNREGWDVGVWEGISLDGGQRLLSWRMNHVR